ncbi:MAG: hypothetical protein H0W08_17495 [Acidobacteria bacterium]|nr:hypothetical protein [Acidobacteriota bacterium]
MSSSEPPRVATALLRRFLDDNEPLAGDLLERFTVRQSRLWFWREVLTAIVIRALQRPDRDHPLGVGEHADFIPHERARLVEQPRQVNLTASPLPGVGGLSLVALGGMVTLVRPQAWWMFVPAVIGGAALGLTMAFVRRRAVLSGPANGNRTLLRVSDDDGEAD